ncbi:efflux RND transporter periplasmic adaptor subunit [Desulfosarcina ovata]|nr:efflux RND transporter periplasmic adaptor subunit [Desulfosarcina ovata]
MPKILTKKYLVLAAALVVGVGLGYGLSGGHSDSALTQVPAHHSAGGMPIVPSAHAALPAPDAPNVKPLYVCPMNCVPPMEKPGKCPVCGMDLVAVATHEHRHDEGPPRMALAADAVRSAGIQVAAVERKAVTREIRLFGKVEYDPVNEYKVTAFAPGVIDKIYVKRAGQTVRAGDALFDLHSSELYYLEQELFATLEKLPYFIDSRPARGQRFKRWVRPWMSPAQPAKSGKEGEIDKAEEQSIMAELSQIRRKMRLLGLAETDIDRIIARGSPSGISTVTTPMGGVVLEQYAFKGTYLNTGEAVFTIANPQYIWAKFDAYASDFPWIKLGQEAEFRSDAYPGETFRGKVIYLDPYFDEKSRTFKVGVLCTDHGDKLKPAMLVRGSIHAHLSYGYRENTHPARNPLVIPDTAPLITGRRSVVYVAVPGSPGTYEGREVSLGPRATGFYVVREGLQEGEQVVVNGNFKIDSAIQIMAKSSMMQPAGEGAMPMPHDHGGASAMQMSTAAGMPAMGSMDMQATGEDILPGSAPDAWGSRAKQIEALRRAIRDGRSRTPSASRGEN